MEAIIYDKSFRKVRILDTFTSFLWNDYYNEAGDFELEYPITENAMAYIEEGYYIQNEETERLMIIETIDVITNYETGNVCRLSGRSLESILLRRPIRYAIAANNSSLQNIISMALNQNFIAPSNPNRKIEGFTFNWSTDPEITKETITAEYDAGTNCYDLICKVCQERHIGFKVTIYNERFFQFDLYKGKDHSYDQSSNPWIVFSAEFENLEESDMKIDTQNLRNCMEIDLTIVETKTNEETGERYEVETVYPLSIGDDVKGLDRRELYGSSTQRLDTIDKSIFGTAEQRVNEKLYSSYEAVYFDSAAYNAAMEKYNASVSARLSSVSTPRQVTETYTLQPGDPGYQDVSDTPGAEWVNTRTRVVEESADSVAKRVSAQAASIEKDAPSKEDYMTYAWVMTDTNGYNAALAAAQAQIDSEYQNAIQAQINFIKAKVIQSAAEELSEYAGITSFDGLVDPNVNFIYGEDYELGDVVQIVNAYRFNAKTRVVGVLFCQDNQNGIIARPSFASDDTAEVVFDLTDAPG